jgi:chromosome partitioning protein
MILAAASLKGGTGKSAAAVHLAAAFAEAGLRVLLVDLDPQANATAWLGCSTSRGLAEALADGEPLAAAVVRSPAVPVDVVPSSGRDLEAAGRILATEIGAELVLRKAVRSMLEAEPDRFDLVLLDTRPAFDLLTIGALVAADRVVVPAEPSALGLSGVAAIEAALGPIRDRLNPDLAVAGILLSRVDRTRLAADVARALADRFGGLLLSTVVRDRVAVRESFGFGQPVTVYATDSEAAADFRAAAAELARRLGLRWQARQAGQASPASHAGQAGEGGA